MLRLRLATAAVAIPLLLLLIFEAPPWAFAVVLIVLATLGVIEYCVLAFPDRAADRAVFALLGTVVAASTGAGGAHPREILLGSLTVLLIGGLVWVLFARPDFEQGLTDFGRAIIGILFCGFLLPHFIWLRTVPDGPYWIVFVILTAMAGDSGGYFVGHAFGRHKLIPRISPGKTVEGAVGILGANLIAGVFTKLMLLPQLGWAEALLLAAGQGTLGQLGDLCESVMKRTYGAKDSGRLFPGHGGMLDRVDSLVFPVAAIYYYVVFCR